MAPEKVRVLVVEDETIVSMEIQDSLRNIGFEPVGCASTAQDALRLTKALQPDLVLMDIRLRGEMDGIEAARIIRSCYHIPVIFTSAFSDKATLQRAKVAEPYGFLVKPFEGQALYAAIETAIYNHRQATGDSRVISYLDKIGLSKREADVVFLLRDGLKDQEIAERLFISQETVKSHLKNVYEKAGVHGRGKLMAKLNHTNTDNSPE